MLGHRGSRLGITFPEIYEMQAKAILEAGIELYKEAGIKVNIEIMIPLIFSPKELELIKENIIDISKKIIKKEEFLPEFLIGTMIELPRAALVADEIAKKADFLVLERMTLLKQLLVLAEMMPEGFWTLI